MRQFHKKDAKKNIMKKLYSLLLMILTITISCNSQENKDKELISNFVKSIILNDSLSVENLTPFFKGGVYTSKKHYDLIKLQTSIIKNQLINQVFDVLSYSEFKNKKEYTDYFISYVPLENVFCLVSNKKYITLFIVEDNKIISFFTGIVKHKNNMIPYVLTK